MAVSVNPLAVEAQAPAPLQSWGALCPEGGSPRLVAEYPGATVTLADHPSVAVLFDGVLHDRAALVARLDAPMESNDAELVAHGWSRLGLSLFEVLSGFFALAILDRRSGEQIRLACIPSSTPSLRTACSFHHRRTPWRPSRASAAG
jgi:hypothetical protein